MARPLLNTSILAQVPKDRASETWARALSQAAGTITEGLDIRREQKEKREADFVKSMDFDINQVSNDIFKGSIADQYEGFKDKWVDAFENQKGKLSTQDKIALQSDMMQLKKSAEYFNQLSKYRDAAEQASFKDPTLKYKKDEWENILQSVIEGDYENVNNLGSAFMQSDAGMPGVTREELSPENMLWGIIPSMKWDGEEVGSTMEIKTTPEGVKYQVPKIEKSIGGWEGLVNKGMTNEAAKKVFPSTDKMALKTLSPEEQEQAVLQFGNEPGSFTRYYLMNKADQSRFSDYHKNRFDYGAASRIPDQKDGRGGGLSLNFGGGSEENYDSNRNDITLKGRTYGDTFTFPEYRTKERVDVAHSAQQIMPDGTLGEPKDITNVARLIGYNMDDDVIIMEDKNGRYFEMPRSKNEVVLKKLVDPDDYGYISDYQSKRTVASPEEKYEESQNQRALNQKYTVGDQVVTAQDLVDRGYSMEQVEQFTQPTAGTTWYGREKEVRPKIRKSSSTATDDVNWDAIEETLGPAGTTVKETQVEISTGGAY